MNQTFECWSDAAVWPTSEVAILYADQVSRCRAEVFMERALDGVYGRARLRIGSWRTDLLVLAEAVGTRFRDFERAEVLILAMQMDYRLPAAVLRGVQRWARGRNCRPAEMVVLWRASDVSTWPPVMQEGLHDLAEQYAIDLISEWELKPSREVQHCIERLSERASLLAEGPAELCAGNLMSDAVIH